MSALLPRSRSGPGDRAGDIPLWLLYPLFFVCVFLSHWTLLRLPYFWDEAGYYIPAALDFYRHGTLIPVTTLTNAHPPLPSVLLAAWWHLSGYVVSGTRTFICMVSAAALLAVYRLGRDLSGPLTGAAAALLTAVYPVWFAQSTLAHADIFAAAFTLWALSVYLAPTTRSPRSTTLLTTLSPRFTTLFTTVLLFSAAALSKETAIITPLSLAGFEAIQYLKTRHHPSKSDSRERAAWAASLLLPVLPLLAWYAYHKHKTGFTFGNPEFLRYNASANLDAYRILLSLWHRLLHLTVHMNMFVPVLCTLAAILSPAVPASTRFALKTKILQRISVVIAANTLAFSILGGALLTRYLLPLYPLLLILCISLWRSHLRLWGGVLLLTAAAFLAAIWINPPYSFAPEDNLTYRDMVVLHVQAISFISQHFPSASVLSAWPASSELERPELGYTRRPFRTSVIKNFSLPEITRAAADPGAYDTALIFSTKWQPSQGHVDLGTQHEAADSRYFDFHRDLTAAQAATLLRGEVVWQGHRGGEWGAILRFPRIVSARLPPRR